MTEQELVEMIKKQMEKNDRQHDRHVKLSQHKGYQDALIDLINQMNDYRTSSDRKTIDVDVVMETLWNHIEENQDDMSTFMDEVNGKGKVLHLDENVKWRHGS